MHKEGGKERGKCSKFYKVLNAQCRRAFLGGVFSGGARASERDQENPAGTKLL